MERIIRAGLAVAALALVVPGAPALAQEGGGSGLELESTTTPREKVDFSRTALTEITDAVRAAGKLAESTESDGEPEAISCVNSKLSSIRTLQEVSERAQRDMNEALAGEDDSRADHEFRKIAVSVSKVRQFLSEAAACAGEEGALESQTEVKVQADAIAEGDDTAPLVGDDVLVGDVNPPQNSPFQ